MPHLNPAPQDFLDWLHRRDQALRDPEGWLTLIDLIWLEPGQWAVGSAADCAVRLPGAPAHLGTLHVHDATVATVVWQPEAGPPQPLMDDTTGPPTVLRWGRYQGFVIAREAGRALRIKDREAPTLRAFNGVPRFPYDPAWRIEARWVGGHAVFLHQGETYRLSPQHPEGDPLHFVIGDASSGRDTYGGGRFLYAERPQDGTLILDFNRAINPPCVFTPYATCPLPPAGNRLPFAIPAGEQRYGPTAP